MLALQPSTITSMMARSVIMFLCWALMAQCRSEDLSTSYSDFLSFLNSDYNNFDDPAASEDMDGIRFILKPVLIPGLQKGPVLFGEETIKGMVHRRWLALQNEASTDRVLYANYYKFLELGNYKPGTFNTDDLANLTREDLYEGCLGFFQRVTPQVLLGEWEDCTTTVKGKHPVYNSIMTCNDFIFESPLASDEASSLEPYHLKQRGLGFPLIGLPEDYVNPCQDDLKEPKPKP